MSVTLINLFAVSPDEAEQFVARFTAAAERFAGLPGFLGTELHRNVGVGDQTYQFVNVATWESAEAWQAAVSGFAPRAGGSGGGVRPTAALYESVLRRPPAGSA